MIGIIGAVLIVAAYIIGRRQGYLDGKYDVESLLEKVLIVRGWGKYVNLPSGQITFEVIENDGQRTVDSDSERKEVPPTESKS
jgi:hypothetical protein